MNSKTLVSIIMPFLNAEKFIQEAIESVFAQTYGNWELFLIDDGSTDGSTNIALRFAKQHPVRVYYLEHEDHQNRGASAARNLGIRNARGKFVAFLDADDVWLPHKLEQQVPILDAHPEAAMVFGTTQWWFSWTGRPEDFQRDYFPELGVQPETLFQPPTLFAPFFLNRTVSTPCPSSILVRREIIDRIGSFEESFKRIYTDQAFYAKLCLVGSVFVVGECWDRYRQHSDSSCSTAKRLGQKQAARKFFLSWLTQYCIEHKVTDPEILKGLREELWPYRHPYLHRILNSVRYRIGQLSTLFQLGG